LDLENTLEKDIKKEEGEEEEEFPPSNRILVEKSLMKQSINLTESLHEEESKPEVKEIGLN